MTAPDYISPMVGYRVWQWDALGLKSLNGVQWHPGKAFAAECRTQGCQEPPRSDCTCGIYASKSLNDLRWTGYTHHGIHGEVCLWGTIVEHERGWRAQFAYPKNLVVPLSMLPLGMSSVESRLAILAAYMRWETAVGADIESTARKSPHDSRVADARWASGACRTAES